MDLEVEEYEIPMSPLSGNLQAVRSFSYTRWRTVAEPLPTLRASHFGNFLNQLEPRLAAVQLQMELRALQWSV
jgi:hypothetical protein